jgi:uncharacterized membrane protein YphA (DoxX/SURF4 family)
MSTLKTNNSSQWHEYEKILFRFFAIYFLLQALPLDWKFWGNLFRINWTDLRFSDIFYISRYTPQFLSGSSTPGTWGLSTLADWALLAIIALVGTVMWSLRDKSLSNYDRLYYWVRVIVRYRLAIGVIAYGFIKFFPLQAPYPSLSNLNTAYGDFNRWKLFSLSLGIVPGYESFLGLIEIIAGLLLLFRRTATIGAFVVVVFTGNVFFSNLAYEGGETIYSLYLITLALFLLAFDALRLYQVVALREPTAANTFRVQLPKGLPANARLVLKTLFIFFFVVLYGYKTYAAYNKDVYQFPRTAALPGAAGLYDVSQYSVNKEVIPYDQDHPNRWQDVVFEKWGTISIKSNEPVTLDTTNTEEIYNTDEKRNYEFAGSAGRIYYNYVIDTTRKVLTLTGRNTKTKDNLILHYTRPDSSTIILSGVRGQKDSVYAQLSKINKKYLLREATGGRTKALKL